MSQLEKLEGHTITKKIRSGPLFPDDVAKRERFNDTHSGSSLLSDYSHWCIAQVDSLPEGRYADEQVYRGLHQEILRDLEDVQNEASESLETASALTRWEFQYIDGDGGTSRIERELAQGNEIFRNEEARAKYRYLAPRGDELSRWKDLYLDRDGGTTKIMGYFIQDIDIFWSKKAKKRYGHLRFKVTEEQRIHAKKLKTAEPSDRKLSFAPDCSVPPDFDYEDFYLNILPSDLRFGKLFPGSRQEDYQKRFDYRDFTTEKKIVGMYMKRMKEAMKEASEKDSDFYDWEFYDGLLRNLQMDFSQSEAKEVALYKQAGNLGKWEYTYLDQDGDTKKVEKMLRKPENNGGVFWCLEAIIHYGHLSPSRAFRERAKAAKEQWEKEVRDAADAAKKAEEAAKQAQKEAAEKLKRAEQSQGHAQEDEESSEYDSDLACAAWPVDGVEPSDL